MRLFRLVVAAALAAGALALAALPAAAKLLIEVDKSAQMMTVSQDGARIYTWPVSTGISRYDTPSGAFTPFRMEKDHFSREWDDAPMPNSIFFTTRGHAIHGTNHTSIGRPASHGCVRLSEQNSRVLFGLVKQEGMANTKVVLFGQIPPSGAPAVARREPRYDDQPRYDDRSGYNRPNYDRPRYDPRGEDDRDVTGSVPPRRVERVYRDDDRPIYWRRAPEFDDRDAQPRSILPPPPFFFPGPRYYRD